MVLIVFDTLWGCIGWKKLIEDTLSMYKVKQPSKNWVKLTLFYALMNNLTLKLKMKDASHCYVQRPQHV